MMYALEFEDDPDIATGTPSPPVFPNATMNEAEGQQSVPPTPRLPHRFPDRSNNTGYEGDGNRSSNATMTGADLLPPLHAPGDEQRDLNVTTRRPTDVSSLVTVNQTTSAKFTGAAHGGARPKERMGGATAVDPNNSTVPSARRNGEAPGRRRSGTGDATVADEVIDALHRCRVEVEIADNEIQRLTAEMNDTISALHDRHSEVSRHNVFIKLVCAGLQVLGVGSVVSMFIFW